MGLLWLEGVVGVLVTLLLVVPWPFERGRLEPLARLLEEIPPRGVALLTPTAVSVVEISGVGGVAVVVFAIS